MAVKTHSVIQDTGSPEKSQYPCWQGLPCAGRSCLKCQRGVYDFAFTCPNMFKVDKNESTLNRKIRRFLIRGFRGKDCGLDKGFRFRWFVLTESNEAISLGIDFSKEFHRFIKWLRYYCPDFQYLVVQHRQGDMSRRNWHVLSYGTDRLPVNKMREYWLKHFKSTVTGMAEVKDISRAMYYVAGYLSDSEKFERAWTSRGWVYSGWVSDSLDYWRRYGEYPELDYLVELARSNDSDELKWSREIMIETGYSDLRYCLDGFEQGCGTTSPDDEVSEALSCL